MITNNPNNPNVTRVVRENLKFIENSNKRKTILEQTTLIISRRQSKNLEQLTQAKFSNSEQELPKKCGEDRCGTCEHLLTVNSIKLKNGEIWTIKSNMTCKAKNVVYIIICILCKSFYVGQTQNLRKRVTLHNEQIHHKQ